MQKGDVVRAKIFIAAILVITGSWLALQLTQNHFRYRIMRNRHQQISVTLKEIEKIKNPLTLAAATPASGGDLLRIVEINRLEGQIRDLHMENAIDLSRSNANVFPEIIPLILLVGIALEIGTLKKKPDPESKSAA